jgi:hypothetical protein
MPLVQGGPPEWIWERPIEQLRWEVLATRPTEERADFELRVHCGFEMMRLQFFTKEEIAELQSLFARIESEQLSL